MDFIKKFDGLVYSLTSNDFGLLINLQLYIKRTSLRKFVIYLEDHARKSTTEH